MVDFEWYRSFVAVYQAGTVSAAAERRSMTQPGISQHLAALERALDSKLFQRTPRAMLPTPEGQQLYTQVIGAVEQLERLSDPRLLRAETPIIAVKVGAPREFFYSDVLPRLAALDGATFRLQVTLGQTAALIRQLEARELDMVIASLPLNRRTVQYVPLQREQFVLVATHGFERPADLQGEALALWLETQAWIAYAPDLPIIRRYWQAVFERRPALMPRLILPDLSMILRAVVLGLGISILPRYLIQVALDAAQVVIPYEPAHDPDNEIYAAFLRERQMSLEIKWLLEVLA